MAVEDQGLAGAVGEPQPRRAVLTGADHPSPIRAERRGRNRTLPGFDDPQFPKGSPAFVECRQGARGCRASRLTCRRQDFEAKRDGRRAITLLQTGSDAVDDGVGLAAQEILVFLTRVPHERHLRLVEQLRRLVHEVECGLEQPAFEPRRAGGTQPLDIVADNEVRAVRGEPGMEARPA